jgi:dienelactone hydrolase
MISILFGIYLFLADTQSLPREPRNALPFPAGVAANLALRPAVGPVVEEKKRDPDGQAILACVAPFQRTDAENPKRVSFDFYEAGGVAAERRPAVVVSPITGGGYELERLIARDLRARGYHAVVVKRPPREQFAAALETFDAFEDSMRDSVASGHRVIDWLVARPDVDPHRIGAYGVSLGGMLTVMLAASDPRIMASVAMMAGGDFPAVLARSIEPEARRFSKANGLPEKPTPQEMADFETRARKIVSTDPLAFAAHVDAHAIFLVNTRRDTSVPSFLQIKLREALGFPETLSLPTGHYSIGIYLPMAMAQARDFLARKFSEP